MPWWSWILIWIALVALSLLLYVLLGIRLFRQFMATFRALAAAGDKLSLVPPRSAEPHDDGTRSSPAPGAAVFASPEQMRHDYLTSKSSRREVRRQRRIQRKSDRGQPQSLRDINFS
ncbi:hypothetical protein [Pseudarthrobacter sp. N5]|uniref:hypothetical protein n=1 Tax=Pseudarthrobacter sp. N5 TaxID=3418416 RepID=UPI003CF0C5BB